MKQLIRYKNRKIYDSDIKNYVTLDDILGMVLEGHKIVVTERETGKDITAITFCQVLSEVVVRERNISVKVLTEVIFAAYNCVDEKSQINYTN